MDVRIQQCLVLGISESNGFHKKAWVWQYQEAGPCILKRDRIKLVKQHEKHFLEMILVYAVSGGVQSEKKDTTDCTEQTSLQRLHWWLLTCQAPGVNFQYLHSTIVTEAQTLNHTRSCLCDSIHLLLHFFNPGLKIFTYSSLSLLF